MHHIMELTENMTHWFISVELFTLILNLIIFLNFYDSKWRKHPKRRLFNFNLILSTASIALNIICVFTISSASMIPLWVNYLLNSLYFLMIVGVCSLLAYYLVNLIFEHIYDSPSLKIYYSVIIGLYLSYVFLIIMNLYNGLIFYFDHNLNYQRGPLINYGYLVMLIELMFLVYYTFRYFKNISLEIRRVIQLLAPIITLLAIYQIIFPGVLFNGGLMVSANIIIVLNFQSRRLEQDSLTLIGNLTSFYQELKLCLTQKQKFQAIAISIRQFGTVNALYGHEIGNDLIYEIGHWLILLQKNSKAFRVGNVEFVLIVPYEGIVSSRNIMNTIHRRFKQPWQIGELKIMLDTRVAELTYTDQNYSATDILEFLRWSLDMAKDRDNQLVRFNEEVFLQFEQRNKIIVAIKNAISKKQLQVWYQPIYDCHQGKFVSCEALLRLFDQDGNMYTPDQFIPLAQQNGLIDELTNQTFDQVFSLLQQQLLPDGFSISVNLSSLQFSSPKLLPMIKEKMEQYNCHFQQINLEITESVLAENINQMGHLMQQLNDMDFSIYMDDFGTGYSNLSTILECPFSVIKLDRSLINQYPENVRSSSIVNTMTDLFHSMNIKVVGEGVETKQQADALIELGIDLIQGFYYAKPMPKRELINFIRNQKEILPK